MSQYTPLELFPKHKSQKYGNAVALFLQANVFLQWGSYDTAISLLKQSLKENPAASVATRLAETYLLHHESDEAEPILDSIAASPTGAHISANYRHHMATIKPFHNHSYISSYGKDPICNTHLTTFLTVFNRNIESIEMKSILIAGFNHELDWDW